ncbi:MAG TPA: hypothetical protein VG817_05920 [Gemmatimonadales bacterium]|nr:hypothetical protein [Gemmatimonadales bacterium]
MRAGTWYVVRGASVLTALISICASAPLRLCAQKLEDNSFLIEEAYNQPTRVVQHISTAELLHGATAFSFTQEWPLGGPQHQLSYSLFLDVDDGSTLGDALLNYRFQALGAEGEKLWAAPRVSAILPVGNGSKLGGNGGWGVDLALPVSWEASRRLTLHGNLGATVRPDAENAAGDHAFTMEPYFGGSAILFLTPKFNLLAESVWRHGEAVVAEDVSQGSWVQTVTLGARVGFDLPGDVQVVPGVAWMPAVDDVPTRSFVYFSIEHGF